MKSDDKPTAVKEREVKFPNQVFLTIRGGKNCELDVAAQLTLQPEPMDEIQRRLKELQKAASKVDYELLNKIEKDLDNYFHKNELKYKLEHGKSDTNFIKENMRKSEYGSTLLEKHRSWKEFNQVKQIKQEKCQEIKLSLEKEYRAKSIEKSQKWDDYRKQREMMQNRAIQIVKNKRRIQVIKSIMK